MTSIHTDIVVSVRYFAAARSATRTDDEVITVAPGTTVDDLIAQLSSKSSELAHILKRCSYLRDGMAVRDLGIELRSGQTLDVLPPFAGG